jgi:acyl carrier protein
MTRDAVAAKLREIMKAADRENIDWSTVEESASIASLGFDSLSILDLVYDIQQAFELEFNAEELAGVTRVSDLVDFLLKRVP